MESSYVVPVISYNLSKDETVFQVAEVLDHLSKVTESLLSRISDRVEQSNKKLQNLTGRIDVVNTKVNKLNGAKKATQVFSSSKYPAADINRQYVSLFSDLNPPTLIRNKVKHRQYVANDEPLEKLYVYHVKNKTREEKVNATGLGDMPEDIRFVNDVLLYNSGKNIYKNFVMSDALNVTQKLREQEATEVSDLEPAPYSISERSNLNRSNTQSYFYSPDLGEVPSLDVPIDLPDLPGIADDLRYENQEDQGIAPSVATTPHIPDLPSIETSSIAEIQEQAGDVALPLPPPPRLDNEQLKKEKQTAVNINTSSQQHIEHTDTDQLPPPPSQVPNDKEEQTNIAIPGTSNIHASLMEAIRKVGGAKNAKLKTVDTEQKDIQQPASGGDLMADLYAKLSMRRKGISGTKKQENILDGSSAMVRISAMIPPPGPKTDINDAANTDDEWDE